jgi:predicted RND superfamily exporter protein
VIHTLESFVFRHRAVILGLLALLTVGMGHQASQLRMDAAFRKQLPLGHEYIDTFLQYQDQLFGADRVIVALRAREGDIWTVDYLRTLSELSEEVFFLPGIDRRTVTSLWTPNTRYIEITEDGMRSTDVIGGDITPENLTEEDVEAIRARVIHGGHVGRLVAEDHTASLVLANVLDVDPLSAEKLDYLELAERLETDVRQRFENDRYAVHILGFVKQMGDIADGAKSAFSFFFLAFVLTALAVYAYSRSWSLTLLALFCSLTSVVWQFGTLHLMGYGLDPLAILVPFLVFAIGVSHGVQQINLISKRVAAGATSEEAARASFSGLLIPGSMALVTDLIGFGTLVLIPIPMIQELGITATIGVAFKIITNLVMLPLLASYLHFDPAFAARSNGAREGRVRAMKFLGRIAERKYAIRTVIAFSLIFVLAVWQSMGRHVGDLHPGAPELAPNSRYNRDAQIIVDKFGLGLDLLTVIVETPENACIDYDVMHYLDEFSWYMANDPAVLSVLSAPVLAKLITSAWNEGNPKWAALPRNRYALVQATSSIPPSAGVFNETCTVMPVQIFTTDHKATTIQRVVERVERFRNARPYPGVRIRLASGNVGVQAAVNEVVEKSETPMMVYVYLTIMALVMVTYRDWRATICCCLPLTLATFLGYWFMRELDIGLKVSTLPVMVLAVGIGVDYAFYIYNRLQLHLSLGLDVTQSYQQTLLETGNAVIFTAITLAVGVSTWALSPLKFQADMGLLLAMMFVMNMIMAVTALPAFAVVLDLLIPRRRPVTAPRIHE